MRASTPMTPFSSASSGLMSSSTISSRSQTSCDSLHQRQRDGVEIGGRPAAIALELVVDARARDQFLRQREIERRQRQRLVGDHFDRRAAAPEQQERAEQRVDRHAQDQFVGVRPRRSFPAPRSPRSAPWAPPPSRASASPRGRSDRVGTQIERHAADIGFVRDVGRIDLERDRAAEFLRAWRTASSTELTTADRAAGIS